MPKTPRSVPTSAEHALIRNQHAIGGDAPTDAAARLSMASDRIKFLGFAIKAISVAERTIGPLDAEGVRTVGMLLQELAEDVNLATELMILQENERDDARQVSQEGGH